MSQARQPPKRGSGSSGSPGNWPAAWRRHRSRRVAGRDSHPRHPPDRHRGSHRPCQPRSQRRPRGRHPGRRRGTGSAASLAQPTPHARQAPAHPLPQLSDHRRAAVAGSVRAVSGSAAREEDQGAEAAHAESLGPLHADRTIAGLLVARGFDLNVPIRDQETHPTPQVHDKETTRYSPDLRRLRRLGRPRPGRAGDRTRSPGGHEYGWEHGGAGRAGMAFTARPRASIMVPIPVTTAEAASSRTPATPAHPELAIAPHTRARWKGSAARSRTRNH